MADMFTIGMILSAVDQASGVFNRMCNNAVTDLGRLQDKLRAVSDHMKQMGQQAAGAGLMMTGALQKTLSAFKDYEQAQVNLKVSVMQEGGIVDTKQFEKLSKLADQLGKDYMGSTEDFYKMFRVLTEQGMTAEKILGGVGKAVADFAAVTGEGYTESALKISKFQDSLGIAANDMVRFADMTSKAKFAFGLDTTEIYYALPHMGAGLKALSLQGIDASRGVLKLMGVLSQAGLPASEVGTSIGQLINRMGDLENILERKRVFENIGPILNKYKIKLDFWDEKGNFAGLENMIKQFEKLNPLSQKEKVETMKHLFGDVAGKAVSILGSKGLTGWKEAEDMMQRQASLGERMAAIQDTLAFKWDSFTGTVKNFTAAIGDSLNKSVGLKFILDKLNNAFDYARGWIKDHQKLAGAIGAVVAVSGVGLLAIGGGLMLLGMATRMLAGGIGAIGTFTKFVQAAIPWVRLKAMEVWRLIGYQKLMAAIEYRGGFWNAMQYWLMTTKYKILEVVGAMSDWIKMQAKAFYTNFLTIDGLKNMAKAFGTTLWTGLKQAIIGIRTLNLAFLTSPIFLITTGIALGAALIYTYWKPIKAFFGGLWAGIKEGLAPLREIFKPLITAAAPIITALKPVFGFFKQLLFPLETSQKTLTLWAGIGKVIGFALTMAFTMPVYAITGFVNLIKGVFNFFINSIRAITSLDWKAAGVKIVTMLAQGIWSKITAPIDAIKSLAKQIRNFLPFSPAKEGPLRDLDKVNIIGTVAKTMEAGPAISAMQRAMNKTRAAMMPPMSPALAAAGSGGGMPPIHVTQSLSFSGNVDHNAAQEMTARVGAATKEAIWQAIDEYFAKRKRVNW